jgi:ADP-ribosyl-[dinitrogen reductase] hydrolase
MRNTPVALYMLHRPIEQLVELAVQQAALTHHDPATHVAAAIHAVMIDAGIRGDDMLEVLVEFLDTLPPRVQAEWRSLLDATWDPESAPLGNGTVWTCLAQAVWAVRRSSSFEEAVVAAIDLGHDADTVGCVAGSLAGARWGIQAIPSRWTTYLNGTLATPDGIARYDYGGLQDLARRLLGSAPVPRTTPEIPKAFVRVHATLPVYAADWKGAVTTPSSWAILSLCRTHGDFRDHPIRREVFLIERYDETDNHDVESAVRDAIDTIDALLAEDGERPVLVHCHGGRSRTGFVLKAWAMRRHSWTEAEAHDWLLSSWPHAHRDNPVFTRILEGGSS